MYRLHIRDYSTAYNAHTWWQNFTTEFRKNDIQDVNQYIYDTYDGIYCPAAHNLVWAIDFPSEEDALAFVLKFS